MKKLEIFYPVGLKTINYFERKIKSNKSIYDIVDTFEKEVFSNISYEEKSVDKRILLNNVLNIHNSDGIKDKKQIQNMIKQLENQKHILTSSNMPNIKFVKTTRNEFLLFDGHHSLLAYMACNRRYMDEVPCIIIDNVSDKEILVFYGKHASRINNWRDYVINWQAEEQLCRRKQQNMGELYEAFFNQ